MAKLMFEPYVVVTYTKIGQSTRTKYRPFTITSSSTVTYFGGSLNLIYPSPTSSTGTGKKCKSFSHAILEQIYIIPEIIDFGVFQVKQTKKFKIWNAFLYVSKTCFNVEEITLPDVDLITNPLITYLFLGWKWHEVEALGTGVPIISGKYIFHFRNGDFIEKTLDIRGLRVGAPRLLCMTPGDISYRYQYITAVAVNELKREQRRLVHERIIRNLSVRFLSFSNIREFLTPSFDILSNRVIATPIIFEPMHPVETGNLENLYELEVKEDISQYSELFDLTSVVMYDDQYSEVKELSSIDKNNRKLRFKQPIQQPLTGSKTVIFPAFFGILSSVKGSSVVDDVLTFDLEIKEFL